jgi:hypothetical protein
MIDQIASRRAAEDAIARELTAQGAIGVPMYMIYSDEDPTDEPAARAALEREGYTGLVVFRPVGTEQEIVATPAYIGPAYSMYWGGYYGYGWGCRGITGRTFARIRSCRSRRSSIRFVRTSSFGAGKARRGIHRASIVWFTIRQARS